MEIKLLRIWEKTGHRTALPSTIQVELGSHWQTFGVNLVRMNVVEMLLELQIYICHINAYYLVYHATALLAPAPFGSN